MFDRLALVLIALTGVGSRSAVAEEPAERPSYPNAIACARDGTIAIVDLHLPGVFLRDSQGQLTVLAKGGSADRTPLRAPRP